MEEAIIPLDLGRMFLGDEPVLFYLEIVVRTAIIYLWTLVLIRWIGGRGVAQLSLIEFLLVIALGSAVGDSLFYPDVPLLHAMLTILLIVLINKGLDAAVNRFRRAKRIIDGVPRELVRDGVIQGGQELRDLASLEVMAMLRLQGISNLGEVRRAYLESNGSVSIFRHDPPRPGLPIVPPPELERRPQPVGGGAVCCGCCGQGLTAMTPDVACPNCGAKDWTRPA